MPPTNPPAQTLRQKLQALGLILPAVAAPLASYVPARRQAGTIYVSGQLPLRDGTLLLTGPMTPGRDPAAAQEAMAQCLLNGLAAAGLVCDLDEITGVVKLGVYVASSPEYTEQHKVANGASDLAQRIFGAEGQHARFAVGVPSLPLGATVELELILACRSAA